jgi:hypothetical protein
LANLDGYSDAHPESDDGQRLILSDVLQSLKRFDLTMQPCTEPLAEGGEWISAASLSAPEVDPLASMLRRFGSAGFKFNRRAAAASLMLRYGWSAGFAITAYLTQSRVPFVRDYALWFSPRTLVRWLLVRDVTFVGCSSDVLAHEPGWLEIVPSNVLLWRLLESLIMLTEPLIASQHAWSGFSRHALWAMATSSWASQFASTGRQLGDEPAAVRQARAMFKLTPEISRAAPELYEVRSASRVRTFQKMRACCLHFKNSDRRFCANCPIIPDSERLERNHDWLASGNA